MRPVRRRDKVVFDDSDNDIVVEQELRASRECLELLARAGNLQAIEAVRAMDERAAAKSARSAATVQPR